MSKSPFAWKLFSLFESSASRHSANLLTDQGLHKSHNTLANFILENLTPWFSLVKILIYIATVNRIRANHYDLAAFSYLAVSVFCVILDADVDAVFHKLEDVAMQSLRPHKGLNLSRTSANTNFSPESQHTNGLVMAELSASVSRNYESRIFFFLLLLSRLWRNIL